MSKDLTRQVKAEARGLWDRILRDLGPQLSGHSDKTDALKRIGRHVPCPVHGGTDGFRLFKDAPQTGGGICNTCGTFPDGFDMLQWLNGWSFVETRDEVADWLGIERESSDAKPQSRTPYRHRKEDQERIRENRGKRRRADEYLRTLLRQTWENAVPLDHPDAEPARLYLARRGLQVGPAREKAVFRCHPSLEYMDEDKNCLGSHPALISVVNDANGQPVTLHRIYLDMEGYKAGVPKPKKLMAYPSDRDLTGGSIPLSPVTGNVLALTEGIETGLAVEQATGLPVWATISNTLMEKIVIPEPVELVLIYGDRDHSEAGQNSVRELKKRLVTESIQAQGFIPVGPIPEGAKSRDWLDVFVEQGPEGVYMPEIVTARTAGQGGE